MRRIVIPFLLLAGALALAAAGLADPGGKGKAKGGHNRYSAQISVADHGSCGNAWATDTSNRTWTVKKNNDGTFRVTRKDKGTFVTLAGTSPGKCDPTGKHGLLVNAGIHGKFHFEYSSPNKTLKFHHWQDKGTNGVSEQFTGDIANS